MSGGTLAPKDEPQYIFTQGPAPVRAQCQVEPLQLRTSPCSMGQRSLPGSVTWHDSVLNSDLIGKSPLIVSKF